MRFFLCCAVFLLGCSGNVRGDDKSSSVDSSDSKSSNRDDRGLFSSVTGSTAPVTCTAMAGNLMNTGICRSRKQCTRISGTEVAGATCANGQVCCTVSLTCTPNANGNPQQVTSSGTHIVNPAGYMPPITCRFNFPRPAGVCQVRLDFLTFNLAQPDMQGFSGDCVTDVFTVTGADNLQNFQTCGTGNGQNLILDYGASDSIMASITLGQANAMFDILVSYIVCNDGSTQNNNKRKGRSISKLGQNTETNNTAMMPAPEGCAQYFTQASDTVRSFNFPNVMAGIAQPQDQAQINGQRYCVCVRNIPGSSQITWRTCTPNDSFFISGSQMSGALSGNQCPTDYIDIPGSQNGRYCGSAFPGAVSSSLKPYMLCVNFDDAEFPGANLPIDPTTGCPIGFTCFGGDPAMPLLRPCDAVTNPNDFCVPGPALTPQIDTGNLGFCLQYQVT